MVSTQVRYVAPVLAAAPLSLVAAGERALFEVEKALGLDDAACATPLLFHVMGNAGLRTYARLLERARRTPGAAARLRATVYESAPSAREPSAAELAATLDELLAELTDPDATLKRFDAYDALVADVDRTAREAVADLETACMVLAHEDALGWPSGPRQGGRVPGLPSLFLVPAGDPLVKDFLDLRKAVAKRDGLQRRDSTAVFAAEAPRGPHDPDDYGRAIFGFLAGPCGLPNVSPARTAAPASVFPPPFFHASSLGRQGRRGPAEHRAAARPREPAGRRGPGGRAAVQDAAARSRGVLPRAPREKKDGPSS